MSKARVMRYSVLSLMIVGGAAGAIALVATFVAMHA
jgi:hypothetical protein